MEQLWKSLGSEESCLESPSWHEEALKEAAARYEAGQEHPVEWADAKRQLRRQSG
jgi:hypothetical protein